MRTLRSKVHTAPTAPLVLHRTMIVKYAIKKFGIHGQLRNKFFLIVIHRFSLKATMNAPRICKLRNGVHKKPQFLLCPTAKGTAKTIAHLSIAEGLRF
jgi:hypothetical protein